MNSKQYILVAILVFFPFIKGGLALSQITTIISVLICLWAAFTVRNAIHKRDKNLLFLIPCLGIGIVSLLAIINPSFRQLDINKLNNSNLESLLLTEKNTKKVDEIRKNIKNVILTNEREPHLSLNIFYNLRNIIKYNFDGFASPAKDYLKEFEKQMKNSFSKWQPTTIYGNLEGFLSCIKLISYIAFFYLVYGTFKKRREIFTAIEIIFIVGVLLAIIGIFQKAYLSDYLGFNKIIGIWEPPEPRYYYSSFTYKNHWSCFALLVVFLGLGILYRYNKNIHYYNFRSKLIPVLILSITLVAISIFHSGSRSGIVIFLIIFHLYVFIHRKPILAFCTRYKIVSLASASFMFLLFIFMPSFLSKSTVQEMKNNTNILFQNISHGEYPLRFHLWSDLCNQIQTHTFWGLGYNSYQAVNPIYQSREVFSMRQVGLEAAHSNYTPLINHGHNDLLEFFSEFGWFGFVLSILPMTLIILKGILFSQSYFTRSILLGSLCYLAYSVIDFPQRTPACLLTMLGVSALALKYSEVSTRTSLS